MPLQLTTSIVWVLAVGQHLQAFLMAWWGRCLAGAPKPCSGTSLGIGHLVTAINTQEPSSGGQRLLFLSSCLERGGPSSLMGSPGSSLGLPQFTWRLLRPGAVCCERQPGGRGLSGLHWAWCIGRGPHQKCHGFQHIDLVFCSITELIYQL